MSLANEDRGGLVGAFIVEDGDEVLSITQGGQVVRSPINDDFRPTGRSTMGVKFVQPKKDDSVVVVARSVEAREEEADEVENGPVEGEDEAGDAGRDRRRRRHRTEVAERRRIARGRRRCNNRESVRVR